MNQYKQKELILNDKMWSVMWKLSWPAILAMLLYGLNVVLDAVFVGAFVGETALAGVSIVYPLSSFTMGIGSLIGVGAGSLLSIALGANDEEKQKRLLGNVNALTLVCSALFMIIGLVLTGPLTEMMGGTGEAYVLGANYFQITVFGAVFWIYGLAANMIVRAEGKMKTAALIMAIGLIANVLFNVLFVVVFEWGVSGAAWASNIGMLVYSVIGYFYFTGKRPSFITNNFSIRWDKSIIKSIFSMGVPALIMTIMTLVQAIVVFNVISNNGTVFEIAFYGAAFRILTLLLTPIFGLMRALQPVIGINYGAGQIERVIQGFWVFSLAALLLILPFWIVSMLAPEFILSSMLPGESLDAEAIFNFRIFVSVLPILPIVFMAMTFFPSIENGKPAAIIGLVRQLVFYVPVMLILPPMWGLKWVYIGSTLIDAIIITWTLLWVLAAFRKLRASKSLSLSNA